MCINQSYTQLRGRMNQSWLILILILQSASAHPDALVPPARWQQSEKCVCWPVGALIVLRALLRQRVWKVSRMARKLSDNEVC